MSTPREEDRRRVEVWRVSGVWEAIGMGALQVGDLFRMFERTGELVDAEDAPISRVTAAPRERAPGWWGVVAEPAELPALDQADRDLHPVGRCTCAGEGRCEWCQRQEP